MTIKYEKAYLEFATTHELEVLKRIAEDMKEYSDKDLKVDAMAAVRLATNSNSDFVILKAEAEAARNRNVLNYFSEDSGLTDLWVTIWAFNDLEGFYTIGVYISDLWQIGPRDANREVASRMYVRKYLEKCVDRQYA